MGFGTLASATIWIDLDWSEANSQRAHIALPDTLQPNHQTCEWGPLAPASPQWPAKWLQMHEQTTQNLESSMNQKKNHQQ